MGHILRCYVNGSRNRQKVGEEAYVRGASSYVCNFYALSMFRKGDGRVNVIAQCILPQVMLAIQPWDDLISENEFVIEY